MDNREPQGNKAHGKRIRARSKQYPFYSLEIALEFVKTVDGIAGNRSVAQETLMAHLGLKTATTRTYSARVSSAKQFGLLDSDGGLRVSDLARRILYPSSDEVRMDLLREAFCSPELYARLIERFEGKSVPDVAALGNILVTEYGITRAVKKTAAQAFLDSCELAGVIREGCLVVSGSAESVQPSGSSPTRMEARDAKPPTEPLIPAQRATDLDPISQKIELALGTNRRVSIQCPSDLRSKEAERLKALIDLLVAAEHEDEKENA